MNLFEVAVFRNPSKDESDAGRGAEIVLAPERILALNKETAVLLAGVILAAKVKKEDIPPANLIAVQIRPFA